jgi:hypothetical protein
MRLARRRRSPEMIRKRVGSPAASVAIATTPGSWEEPVLPDADSEALELLLVLQDVKYVRYLSAAPPASH